MGRLQRPRDGSELTSSQVKVRGEHFLVRFERSKQPNIAKGFLADAIKRPDLKSRDVPR